MKSSVDMLHSHEDLCLASYSKQSSDNPLYTQALSLLPREKCGKFTAAFALLTGIALINCWWFISLSGNNAQFDLFNSNNVESGDHKSSSNSKVVPPLAKEGESCDFSRGSWVPNARPPLYTNKTCRYIHPSQDCMKNGRPDRGYLNWRWQPISCDLPNFDAQVFLAFMKHKNMMFIGDSIARNHMQSLLCALSQCLIAGGLSCYLISQMQRRLRLWIRVEEFTLLYQATIGTGGCLDQEESRCGSLLSYF